MKEEEEEEEEEKKRLFCKWLKKKDMTCSFVIYTSEMFPSMEADHNWKLAQIGIFLVCQRARNQNLLWCYTVFHSNVT